MSSLKSVDTDLLNHYQEVRLRSEELCEPLEIEDYGVQPMADASPPKWHLAHTTWFFETFILAEIGENYQPFHPTYRYLFNSYYENVGSRHPRPERGNLSRPTVREVMTYRYHVDSTMRGLLTQQLDAEIKDRVVLGIHHEQQHQELLLTDLKSNFGKNPLFPVYSTSDENTELVDEENSESFTALRFHQISGGKTSIGTNASNQFCFDNETPRHTVWLEPFTIANRLVTNSEYLQFIEDGGYAESTLWLSDGWHEVQSRQWTKPEYWYFDEDLGWCEYTLHGLRPINPHTPVTHISLYEADAFARWSQRRLPTEFEWEAAVNQTLRERTNGRSADQEANLGQRDVFHPTQATGGDHIQQLLGDCWEWTASAYSPYPGFKPARGALGEYNGKFMANQFVLRGGSCVTPTNHIRTTYRNFFYPKDRWQFTGIRLADNLG